jgi:hypothetical protein
MMVLFKEVALLCTCLAYIFFGLIRQWRRPARHRPASHHSA